MGACGRTPSCPVRLSRAPARPRGRDRGHPGQPHTPLLLTCVVPTACPGPGVRTNVEGKAGTGLVPSPAPGPLSSPRSPLQLPGPSPAPGPPQDAGTLSAGGRGLDTMTLRGHYVIHLVLAVSLHSCLDRLKDHEAISSTNHVDLTNICPAALCARSAGRGHFCSSCQLAYPASP